MKHNAELLLLTSSGVALISYIELNFLYLDPITYVGLAPC
jgi:hypothetical protein